MFCKGGVQSHQFTEPEQVTTAQGGVFCQVIPIGAGPFAAAMHSISMGDVTLNLGQVSACMGLLRTASDRALLQLPLEGAESLTLNTVPYRPGMVGTYAGGADLLRVGSRPTSFATLVLPSDAVETLLEPAAESRLLQPGGFALMQASSGLRGSGQADHHRGESDGQHHTGRLRGRAAALCIAGRLAQGGARPRLAGAGRKDLHAAQHPSAAAHCASGGRLHPHPPGSTDLLGGTL